VGTSGVGSQGCRRRPFCRRFVPSVDSPLMPHSMSWGGDTLVRTGWRTTSRDTGRGTCRPDPNRLTPSGTRHSSHRCCRCRGLIVPCRGRRDPFARTDNDRIPHLCRYCRLSGPSSH
jgi:hypothetical protein